MSSDMESKMQDRYDAMDAELKATAKAAVETERKAIANDLCRDCKSGYAPTYDPGTNYYYHHVGSESEIGCTASAVHSRTRNAS